MAECNEFCGATFEKFSDIPRQALLVKRAVVMTCSDFHFLAHSDASVALNAIDKALKECPRELQGQCWANDFDGLDSAIGECLRREGFQATERLAELCPTQPFSQTVECLTVLSRLVPFYEGVDSLIAMLRQKAKEFVGQVRLTRAHMNEDAPGTWGEVFEGLSRPVAQALDRVKADAALFQTVLAGSVVFGSVKAPKDYAERVVVHLSELSGLSLKTPSNTDSSALSDLMMGGAGLLMLNSDLRILAMTFQRFVHGFFIYGSGPRAGLAEITLPAIAPGSTIMPGKINPSMAMLLEQVAQHLAAVDQMALYSYNEFDFDQSYQSAGTLIMTAEAIELLGKASRLFVQKCLEGFTVRHAVNEEHLSNALSHLRLVRGLLGEDAARRVSEVMRADGLNVVQALKQTGAATEEEMEAIFDLSALASNGLSIEQLRQCLKD